MGLLLARKKIDKKYYIVDDIQEETYSIPADICNNSIYFDPNTKLEANEWYYLNDFSAKDYFLCIMNRVISTAEYNRLTEVNNTDIDVIVERRNHFVFFQKITASKVIYSKKFCHFLENGCGIREETDSIEIAAIPSIIYNQIEDKLYFRKFSDLTAIFDGIIELYREASDAEVMAFFNLDFINTVDFTVDDVKTENRKRISMVRQEMGEWTDAERQTVMRYIHEYAIDISYENGRFLIHNDKELRLLIWGLELRFYRTIVGDKKYIANSVRSIE